MLGDNAGLVDKNVRVDCFCVLNQANEGEIREEAESKKQLAKMFAGCLPKSMEVSMFLVPYIPGESERSTNEHVTTLRGAIFEGLKSGGNMRLRQITREHNKLVAQVNDPHVLQRAGAILFPGALKEMLKTKAVKFVLEEFCHQRGCNRLSQVTIENRSAYPLRLSKSGSYSGFFWTPLSQAFGNHYDGYEEIPPGWSGGFVHTKTSDAACGSVGYVSVTIPNMDGGDYVACLGFSTSYSGTNSAGIELRDFGEGDVTNINNLVVQKYHAGQSKTTHSKEMGKLTVLCTFTNESWSDFHYVVRSR
ncbi:hypothetical protein GGF32_009841 [Allomyces javanicus]|nr:hypothetical protein GGF32_009841 [Allomyces javanicus]